MLSGTAIDPSLSLCMNEEQNEFSRERFLVVDDDPTISEIVEVYLKMGAAIEVYKAESPLLALRV